MEKNKDGNLPYKVKVESDPDLPPVLKMFVPLGIEDVPGYWTIVLIIPQQGATVWARAKGAYPKVSPQAPAWLVSWKYGKGMTWSVADDLDCPWWGSTYYPSEQKYGLDIMMNIILYSLGRPLPGDIILVNAVRRGFELYSHRSSMLPSLFDFVERFGVSSDRLQAEKLRMDLAMEDAMDSYMQGLYQEALDKARAVHEALGNLQTRCMELKDQALLWVYVTEWASVSGTGMIAGYILYLLLLKRKLYREVGITKATS